MDEANSPEAWYRRLPPITKWIMTATFVVTMLFVLNLLSPALLVLDMRLVVGRLHVWRLFTNFLVIGRFSFGWLLHMYLFCQFSTKLEQSAVFEQHVSGYLHFILFQMLCLDLFSACLYYPTGLPQLGTSLLFAILYYWSRREPYAHVGMWGFTVEAYKFPFVLMLLDLMMGNSLMSDIFGLLSGHIYYFLRELWPADGGPNLLETPPLLLEKCMSKLLSLTPGNRPATRPAAAAATTTGEGGWGGGGTSTMEGGRRGLSFWSGGQATQRREFTGPGYRLGGGD
eukprot:GHVS01028124.1.p1 GENE.GHVS01028124.1~~GHVS01028124.1.p1  ORF type:complete len:296 (-),score=38.51 GHVS01028124.1:313-1164(-)